MPLHLFDTSYSPHSRNPVKQEWGVVICMSIIFTKLITPHVMQANKVQETTALIWSIINLTSSSMQKLIRQMICRPVADKSVL